MSLEHKDWQGQTDGQPWMQRTLIRWLSVVDQRVIYGVMAIVVCFYMLFGHRGYVAMYHFYRRCRGERPLRAFCHVYANHYRFGQVVIDRFAAFGGRRFKFVFDASAKAQYDALCREADGFVQVSSHMGNYELAGYSLQVAGKWLYPLVFRNEKEVIMMNRQRMFVANHIEMVPVMADMSHIFTLNNALRDGNIVSMPGDRVFGSAKALAVNFMGGVADLPVGPFQMAVTREVRLVPIFVMKERWDTYRIIMSPLVADASLPKRERMQRLAQQFADVMAEVVEQYPTQWFNYFEFVKK